MHVSIESAKPDPVTAVSHTVIDGNRPVIREPERIPDNIFHELMSRSKFMQRLLSDGGPIERIPILDVVNPISDYRRNYEYPVPGIERVRLIPELLLNENSIRPVSPRDVAEKFLNGAYPAAIYLKPDGSAGGNGIIRLERCEENITVILRNPLEFPLPSQEAIFKYAVERSIANRVEGLNRSTVIFEISRSDSETAIAALTQICTLALTTDFRRISDEKFAYRDLNSGLVEEAYRFITIDDRAVESRYFVRYKEGRFSLCEGNRLDGTPISSYLKRGQDRYAVNGGDVAAVWPEMHAPIIKQLHLECTEEQFSEYARALATLQAGRTLLNFLNLCERPREAFAEVAEARFVIDISWKDGDLTEANMPPGKPPFLAPRPILVESDMGVRWSAEQAGAEPTVPA